jgi:hypothetical protein
MRHCKTIRALVPLRGFGCGVLLLLFLASCERNAPRTVEDADAAVASGGAELSSEAAGEVHRIADEDDVSPVADDAPPVGWAGTVRDSAGVQLVMNPARALWGDSDQWRLRETLRIGEVEGVPSLQFGKITGLTMDADGRIYVLDSHYHSVRVFSAEGALLGSYGRRGAGPGEFSALLGGLLIGRGDTVLVPDLLNARINWFADEGRSSGSHPPIDAAGGIHGLAWRLHPNGVLWSELEIPARIPPAVAMDTWLIARDLRGQAIDTLMTYRRSTGSAASDAFTFRLFAPRMVWGIGPDGEMLHAFTTEYRVHVREGNRLVRVISRPVERQAVGRSSTNLLSTRARRVTEVVGLEMQVKLDLSDGLPVITGMLGGPDRTLWVQRGVSSAELPERLRGTEDQLLSIHEFGSRAWDIFDARGRYLGELQMPRGFQLFAIHGTRLLGIWRDELNVEYVKVLSLETV